MQTERKQTSKEMVTFMANPEFRDQIREAAAESGECLSVWIRDALRAKLAEQRDAQAA